MIATRAGRRVAVHVRPGTGDRTIVFCHAAPGAGVLDPQPDVTDARGVTLIGVDRPGYGKSDPVGTGDWPSVAAAADDVADVLAELNTGQVGVVGWSAGGRVALALAARHPDLVDRVVVAATPAPHEAVPWIPAEHAASLDNLGRLPADQALAALTEQLAPMAAAASDVDGALEVVGRSPGDDAALAEPGAAGRLAATVMAGFAQGATGLAADIVAYTMRPWGFEPANVAAKVLLLYGSADPIAGTAHGRWWQRALPAARLETVPRAGHLLVLPMWPRMLAHLAPAR